VKIACPPPGRGRGSQSNDSDETNVMTTTLSFEKKIKQAIHPRNICTYNECNDVISLEYFYSTTATCLTIITMFLYYIFVALFNDKTVE